MQGVVNVLGLCAGVGGLELGIRIAEPAARGVAYVEREAHACAVLAARMEEGALHPAAIWSDLATFDGKPWRGIVDCLASGDPCQPNSVAGKRRGSDDSRFLIDQVIRIIEECRPDRVFRENVPGNADGQLAALVPALEGLGYRVAAGIFSAGEVGASHRRERLFIMADRRLDDALCGRHVDTDEALQPGWHGAVDASGSGAMGLKQRSDRPANMADASEPRSQGGEQHPACDRSWHGAEAYGPAGEFRGACFPAFAPGPADPRWPAIIYASPQLEPAVCRMADGMAAKLDRSGRVDRLRACGNGVVPLAAAYAWTCLEGRLRR